MRYYIEDLSGRVERYDEALVSAIQQLVSRESVKMLRPGKGLLSLVPRKYKNSENVFKRFTKAAEGLLNYVYTLVMVACKKPEVLHLQWLPFMEVNGWEIPILKCFKKLSRKTQLVLTIHNVHII